MHGKYPDVFPLHEEAFNVEGQEAWYCRFASVEQANEVIRKAWALAEGLSEKFRQYKVEEKELRARAMWTPKDDKSFLGDVLVTPELEPIGFCFDIGVHDMVFTLQGHHIPYPRFVEERHQA